MSDTEKLELCTIRDMLLANCDEDVKFGLSLFKQTNFFKCNQECIITNIPIDRLYSWDRIACQLPLTQSYTQILVIDYVTESHNPYLKQWNIIQHISPSLKF